VIVFFHPNEVFWGLVQMLLRDPKACVLFFQKMGNPDSNSLHTDRYWIWYLCFVCLCCSSFLFLSQILVGLGLIILKDNLAICDTENQGRSKAKLGLG